MYFSEHVFQLARARLLGWVLVTCGS